MADKRSARINDQFRREIGEIIQYHVKDPGISKGMASVVRVEVTRDLSHAKVFLSVMGTEREKREVFKAVERAGGFIRSELGSRVRIRRVPELHFILDDSIEYAVNMAQKIDEVIGTDDE